MNKSFGQKNPGGRDQGLSYKSDDRGWSSEILKGTTSEVYQLIFFVRVALNGPTLTLHHLRVEYLNTTNRKVFLIKLELLKNTVDLAFSKTVELAVKLTAFERVYEFNEFLFSSVIYYYSTVLFASLQSRSQSTRYPYPAAWTGNKDLCDKVFRYDRI